MKTIKSVFVPALRAEANHSCKESSRYLEMHGFDVRHEKRGCFFQSRVYLQGQDVSGSLNNEELAVFLKGVQGARKIAGQSQ